MLIFNGLGWPPEILAGQAVTKYESCTLINLEGVAATLGLQSDFPCRCHGRLFSHYPLNSLVHILAGVLFGGFAAGAI
jgi:hypothetical protein